MKNVKQVITDIEFENDITFPSYLSWENPHHLKLWLEDEDNADIDMSALKAEIASHEALKIGVTADEMKEVFTMLKNRQLHPVGEFDKAGRFYLQDRELVNVRSPSVKYPLSEMAAGRTAKFVKLLCEKYRCQTKDDLIAKFKKA